MPLFQGFRPVTGTICPSRAAAVVGPSRAPQGIKKGRRPRRRPRLKLSDKAGPDQCPVPGENALFPAQIAGFLAVSRPVPVYPVFLNYVVPVQTLPDPGEPLAWNVSNLDTSSLLREIRQISAGINRNKLIDFYSDLCYTKDTERKRYFIGGLRYENYCDYQCKRRRW